MAYTDRMKAARIACRLTQEQLAARIGVKKPTYNGYEKGNSEPSMATLVRLMDVLGVDANYLFQDELKLRADGVTPEEWAWVKKYRALDGHGKKLVGLLLDAEHARAEAEEAARPVPVKVIPLLGTAAAAGPGEPDTELPWVDHAVPASSPAEFAARISGDSMEPLLHDGDVALCVRRRPEIGDIAVMTVNGALYVKQYIRDNYGNVYLRSLNRARRDCDLDVMASGSDSVLCWGTLLLDRRVPLVDE